MNEQQMKRVYEIFGMAESLTKMLKMAPNPEKRGSLKGEVEVHYTSPFLKELQTIPDLTVKEWGRCGARHPDGYVCGRPEEDKHRMHADGAMAWENTEYGIDKEKLRVEADIKRNTEKREREEKEKPKPPTHEPVKNDIVKAKEVDRETQAKADAAAKATKEKS